MNKLLRIIVPLLLGVALLIAGMATLYYRSLVAPVGEGESLEFEVRRGSGARRVGEELYRAGIVSSAESVPLLARTLYRSKTIKAGIYRLSPQLSANEIMTILTDGRVEMVTFTIPEGWHNRQIADHLAARGFVSSAQEFHQLTRDREVLDRFAIPAETSEGYLFPETYSIPHGYPPERIHEAMLRRFFHVLEQVQPSATLNRQELHQTVILASMIEREAVHAEELPIMARVFLNRIEQNMRLQSCATIQYLLPKPKPRLLYSDLDIPSPYNTYRNAGLPPGPVSNPGVKALRAAFYPAEVDYLFFVLKPDNTHHFARTYREHMDAKSRFLDGRFQ